MDETVSADTIKRAAEWIMAGRKAVVFTGAGVSTESGIPDFRSAGGIWSRFDPDDFTMEKFLESADNRNRQWILLAKSGLFNRAEPNDAHKSISWLEAMGKIRCIITQNVDDLHQKAGSDPEKVYELHGNMKWMKCLDCLTRYPLDDLLLRYGSRPEAPVCEKCRGILKTDVIFFGEALPEATLREASYHAGTCDLFIVIGSSLVVYPAAYMPMYAKRGGARLIIINRTETPYDQEADIIIRAGAGDVMTQITARIRKGLS